jgi:N-acetylglucosaminyldiphosphoundecaprenol N-acetyl-beta-D-mannosaminyltransferase
MNILGVKINKLRKQEALGRVESFLNSAKSHKIFTPNPEMLVDAQKDEDFKEVLNKGDLNICDGFGLSVVGRVKKIAGVDFMIDICALVEKENKSVYLIGSESKEIVEKTASELKKKFPNLKIVGAVPGPKLEVGNEKDDDVVHDIIMAAPDVLFVAFGHGKQEKWIHENLKDLPSVKVAMGVGGSFDFISGKVKRAPKFLQKLGLEWLFRLIMQPKRIKRIFKATFIFLYLYVRRGRSI